MLRRRVLQRLADSKRLLEEKNAQLQALTREERVLFKASSLLFKPHQGRHTISSFLGVFSCSVEAPTVLGKQPNPCNLLGLLASQSA